MTGHSADRIVKTTLADQSPTPPVGVGVAAGRFLDRLPALLLALLCLRAAELAIGLQSISTMLSIQRARWQVGVVLIDHLLHFVKANAA